MKRQLSILALVAGLFALGSTAHVDAQAEAEDPAASRSTAFQAVTGAVKEDVPGGPLLVGAYAVALVVLVGYVARLASLQSQTSAELRRLSAALQKKIDASRG